MISKYCFLTLSLFLFSIQWLHADDGLDEDSLLLESASYSYVGLDNKDIDIQSEHISIKIISNTKALYTINYTILCKKENGQLKAVFDSGVLPSEFKVLLDDKPIVLSNLKKDSVVLSDDLDIDQSTYTQYFNTYGMDINKGRHTFSVNYIGTSSMSFKGGIREANARLFYYDFAQNTTWNNFDTLCFSVDLSSVKQGLAYVTIGDSLYEINKENKQEWVFDKVPQQRFSIKYTPQVIKYTEIIYLSVFTLLFFLNLCWIVIWRKKHLDKRFSPPVLFGAILVPILSIVVLVLINNEIFNIAEQTYIFVEEAAFFTLAMMILTPVIIVIYFALGWLFDFLIKRLSRRKNIKN